MGFKLAKSFGWTLARDSNPGGGVRPSTGAALLTWDGHASTLLIQWDGDDGLPRYLEWDT